MKIRNMKTQDVTAVSHIEQLAWGDAAANTDQIISRLTTFPEGSIVAELPGGKLVGYASAQLVNEISTKSWAEQTDNGYIAASHKPQGQIAYGVSMSGLPEAAKYSVGAHVIKHYHNVFIKTNRCSILCLGSRLPGFRKWTTQTSGDVKHYLKQNRGGYSQDPELRLYQKNGFQLMWELKDYYPDPDSHNYGAMIARR